MSERKYWLGFNAVKGIGPVRLRALHHYFGDLAIAWHGSEVDLLAAGLDHGALDNLRLARQSVDLDRLIEELDQLGAAVLTLDDPAFPPLLAELPDAPPVLYMKGDLADVDQWAVAFVGTRRATAYGRDMTRRLVTDLVHAGITIVSGLALGIDTVAHRAAIEAGGRTIAVLGCGIDIVYPPENRNLAEAVAATGALLTQFPPGTPPDGRNFPVRNRVISGLALGVVVVEAPESSGALLTADAAVDQGRDVFAVPGHVTSRASMGTNRLIQAGAKLVISAEDIMDELNLTRSTVETRTQIREIAPSNDIEAALLRQLGDEPLHIDELCHRTGLPVMEVSSALSLMELKGMVRRLEGMSYALAQGGGELYRLD